MATLLTLKEAKVEVKSIIVSTVVKPTQWLVVAGVGTCPECATPVRTYLLVVSSEEDDTVLEAMTLWPLAQVEASSVVLPEVR